MEAYQRLLRVISSYLFGWLEIKWVGIEEVELNILIVAIILAGAYVRAQAAFGFGITRFGLVYIATVCIWTFAVCFFIVVLPMLLLPSWWGVIGGVIGVALIVLSATFPSQVGSIIFKAGFVGRYLVPRRARVCRELRGVVYVCIALVISNYTLFQIL